MRTPILLAFAAFLLSACGAKANANPDNFYAPKLLSDERLLTLVVSVEIDSRDGKKSPAKLFEFYGFSGNGPSIEQVVKHNAPHLTGKFDSEGDAFVLTLSNRPDFDAARATLRCVEDVKCLASWLASARSILLKE